MCSNCGQHRNQCFCHCCCHTGFETTQVRTIFTADELIRVDEFTEAFLRRFGRLPTVDERRRIEEMMFGDRISQRGFSSINRRSR